MDLAQEKTVWRQKAKAYRPSSAAHIAVQQYFIDFMSQQTGRWGVYWALSQEPELASDWIKTLQSGLGSCKLVFPFIQNNKMMFAEGSAGFEKTELGFMQPKLADGCEVFAPSDLNGAFIPGLAFDRAGVRLGRGMGFYDRFFSDFKGLKIGVCTHEQVYKQLPFEQHDIKMDQLLTDKGWIQFGHTLERVKQQLN